MTRRLFISHSSDDEAVVTRIVEQLERQGASCWIASRDIPPTAIYAEEITKAIKNADVCVVIFSKAANASKPVMREIELGSRYDKPLAPIRIDDAEPAPAFEYYLHNVQWLDYRRNGDDALKRLTPSAAPAPKAPPVAATRALGKFGKQALTCGIEGEWSAAGQQFSFSVKDDTIHVRISTGETEVHRITSVNGPMMTDGEKLEFWAIYAENTQMLVGPKKPTMLYSRGLGSGAVKQVNLQRR